MGACQITSEHMTNAKIGCALVVLSWTINRPISFIKCDAMFRSCSRSGALRGRRARGVGDLRDELRDRTIEGRCEQRATARASSRADSRSSPLSNSLQ
jgi:hypothetical protein